MCANGKFTSNSDKQWLFELVKIMLFTKQNYLSFKGISPKVSVITRMEFELAYYNTIQYAIAIPPPLLSRLLVQRDNDI